MAAELAAGRVGTAQGPAGASGTGSAMNPLVRWGVVGSCGTGRDGAPTAHNPEVEGSNPSPATTTELGFRLSPPLLACAFGLVVNGFVNGGVRDRLCGPRSVAAQDELRYCLGGRCIQAGEDVAVGVEREPDGRVPEPLADDFGRHARCQRRARVAVADVVQPDLGQPGCAAVLFEPAGDEVRVDWCAVWPGERQP